ncbi:MAG: hypothetical protein M1826_000348 [Phylliscum demangeonii]|nr:MAG: hypothetical protein M1826_000348 [Phylliscum demangeonii]
MSSSNEQTQSAVFQPLLERLQPERMATWASEARQKLVPGEEVVKCAVLDPPLLGSNHILFVLLFADGARWLLKIPATGYRDAWDDRSAEGLRSEALTMRLLRRTTSIPVPEVYGFNESIEPQLGCAYILLEYMDGVPLYEAWFDRSLPAAALDKVRKRVLTELALAMHQLGQFTFECGGAPRFDDTNHLTDVGAMKMIDWEAVLQALEAGEHDQSLPLCTVGPFLDPRDYFRCMVERHTPSARDPLGQGVHEMLLLVISWMPGPQSGHPFVLAHPDLDIQNILVGRDGALKAVIDWDGVAAVPRCVGNECYPSWLTRDWDPTKYRYSATDPSANCHEDSPEELERYRMWYVTQMNEAGALGDHTKRSLLWHNIEIAALDHFSSSGIMVQVVDDLLGAQVQKGEDRDRLYCYDIACKLAQGERDGAQLRKLRAAFQPWCDVSPEPGVESD